MQVVYAFVYYFLWIFISLTVLLLVFVFPSTRRILHKIQTKYQNILNNSVFKAIINFSFVVIAIILIDSIRSFMSLSNHFKQHEHTLANIGLERMDLLKNESGESILGVLKEQRQYYLSQRNIMLTLSALFVYFVFQRLFFNIRKLADEQHRQANPLAKSVIYQVIAQLAQLNKADSATQSTQKKEPQKDGQRPKKD